MTTVDQLQAFVFVPLTKGATTQSRMARNEASVNLKSNRFAFSTEFGNGLREEGFLYLRLAKNQFTGDIAVVLSKVEDAGTLKLSPKITNKRCYGLQVSNKNLIQELVAALSLDATKSVVHVELSDNLSKREDTKFFLVSKI